MITLKKCITCLLIVLTINFTNVINFVNGSVLDIPIDQVKDLKVNVILLVDKRRSEDVNTLMHYLTTIIPVGCDYCQEPPCPIPPNSWNFRGNRFNITFHIVEKIEDLDPRLKSSPLFIVLFDANFDSPDSWKIKLQEHMVSIKNINRGTFIMYAPMNTRELCNQLGAEKVRQSLEDMSNYIYYELQNIMEEKHFDVYQTLTLSTDFSNYSDYNKLFKGIYYQLSSAYNIGRISCEPSQLAYQQMSPKPKEQSSKPFVCLGAVAVLAVCAMLCYFIVKK